MTTLTLNTSQETSRKNTFRTTLGFSGYFNFCIRPEVKDVIIVNKFKPSFDINLNENDLTIQSMDFATSSFSEEWNKEDDEFWNNY